MKTTLILLTAALALSACTGASRFAGPSGEQLISVRCDGFAQSAGDCLRRLSEECPNGYQVVGANSSSTPIYTSGSSFDRFSGGGGSTGGAMIQREVIALCK